MSAQLMLFATGHDCSSQQCQTSIDFKGSLCDKHDLELWQGLVIPGDFGVSLYSNLAFQGTFPEKMKLKT